MNVDYSLIGSRIKSKRKEKRMTQEMLAEALEVSVGYVSQVERGVTKISLDLLAEISGILECDIAFLSPARPPPGKIISKRSLLQNTTGCPCATKGSCSGS